MDSPEQRDGEIEALTREAEELQKEADRLADSGSYFQARMKRDDGKALLAEVERLKASPPPSV